MTVHFLHGAGVPKSDLVPDRYPLLRRVVAVFGSNAVAAPPMPAPDDPDAQAWMGCMDEVLAGVAKDDVLIGHSLGGSVLLQWITERRTDLAARALICCASPYWGMGGWDSASFALRPDVDAVPGTIARVVFCGAEDDEIVDVGHLDLYAARLRRIEVIRLSSGGHDVDTDEVEQILKEVARP